MVDIKKKAAAKKAVEYIEDGMKLGLGSGSTMYFVLEHLAEKIKQGMNIVGVPSSKRTEGWANEMGIPLTTFSNVDELDLTIDGADEVDQSFQLTKGGGGSLLREKIVCVQAKKCIIVVDNSKLVSHLGAFPLPVEVVPFGWEVTAKKIAKLGCTPTLRTKDGDVFVSNNGNYILDCSFKEIKNPEQLHIKLKQMVGVVETGLFINLVDKVIVGKEDGSANVLVNGQI